MTTLIIAYCLIAVLMIGVLLISKNNQPRF